MNAPTPDRSGERIAKLLARAGIASRREVERMITDGRVKLNDEVITTPNTVLPNLKGVSVDGKPVKAAEATRLFVFHKPSGLITAERDPAGRPTIYTALRNALPEDAGRVMPIGRLDYNTEGLLLLTNDGELKRAMELPSTGLPRIYRARTFGDITQQQLEELIEGVTIDGMHYGKIDANMERRTGRNQWIEVKITEGKNREVRRVLEYLGLEVSRLLRTAYGPFQLLDLPRGQALEIRPQDVERFRHALIGGAKDEFVPRTSPQQARARIARARPASSKPDGLRSGDRGSDRTRERPNERTGQRSNQRSGERSGDRFGERGFERSDDRPRGRRPARPGERKVPAGKPPADRQRSDAARDRKPIDGKLTPRQPSSAAPRGDARPPRSDSRPPRRDDQRSSGPRSSGPRSNGPRSSGPRSSGPHSGGRGKPGPRR